MLDFDRIRHLLSPEHLRTKTVVQVGLGSGGAPVCDHLTMNGVRNWVLYDPDILDSVNLVKHPRRRVDVGRLKVDIQKEWILDRNPEASVITRPEDVFESTHFQKDVAESSLVLCCADKRAVRSFVNSIVIQQQKPCVTASVFRRGFGGEVFVYLPGKGGCFDCMERISTANGMNIGERIEPTEIEKETIYGFNLPDFKASGLSLDIQSISNIQARCALDILLDGIDTAITPIPANWIIYYNRGLPEHNGGGHFKNTMFFLKGQKGCSCQNID